MFRITSKMIETKPFDVTRDAWRVMQRRAMEAVGRYWFEHFFPDHFNPQAKYRYQHQPRNNEYKKNKERLANRPSARVRVRMGGQVDLVFSGAMMDALTRGCIIRGFPTRVKVTMIGPKYTGSTGFSRKKLRYMTRQPNKKAEMITVTNDQIVVLKRVLRESIDADMQAFRARRETKL